MIISIRDCRNYCYDAKPQLFLACFVVVVVVVVVVLIDVAVHKGLVVVDKTTILTL